jgi:uncharacterized oxidoreductase
MQVAGKTVVLTGGTDGIGKALAHQLRAKEAKLILVGRNPARIEQANAEGFDVVSCDLSTMEGIDTLIAALSEHDIDILINNAGAGSDHDFRITDPNLVDNDGCIALNLKAPVHLITRLMAQLKSRPEAMIVNITSGLAIAPRAGGPIYCATKAGLRSYTLALREQLKGTRIHVLEALPPIVETKMTAGRKNKKMSADDCAAEIIRAMERNKDEANVGLTKLLRIVYSISPALARRAMIKF